jgi:hypothetical protein
MVALIAAGPATRPVASLDDAEASYRGRVDAVTKSYDSELAKAEQDRLAGIKQADDQHLADLQTLLNRALKAGDADQVVAIKQKIDAANAKSKVDPNKHLVNLLDLVKVPQDAVNGTWSIKDGALVSDESSLCRIEFPYQPPEEYDYRVVFTRKSGDDCFTQICMGGKSQFAWMLGGWGNKITGFQYIDGIGIDQNKTGVKKNSWLKDGQEYTSVVKIRKTGVEAYLDGKLVASWKTDFADMSLDPAWALNNNNVIGIGTWTTPTVFHTVEVVEVTGRGVILGRLKR